MFEIPIANDRPRRLPSPAQGIGVQLALPASAAALVVLENVDF
jgi:hypothetical protein